MTPQVLCTLAVLAAAGAAWAGKAIRPAVQRRRARRYRAGQDCILLLRVEGEFATRPDLWEQFIAAHPELTPDRAGGA